jgi:hypothetical protein
MEDLRIAVSKIKLPIELPPAAFSIKDAEIHLSDMIAIVNTLRDSLKDYLDTEQTITNVTYNIFALPLKDTRYLFVKLHECSIVSIDIVSRY